MKKSNSALALLMSAVMSVTLLSPDMFGNNVAKADQADSASTSTSVTIDSSKLDDLKALKEAVLEGLAGQTNYADYEFYYEYSFDDISPSSVYTPSFLVNDKEVEEYFGDTSSISGTIIGITDEAYTLLHSKLVSYAKTSGIFEQTITDYAKKLAQEEYDKLKEEKIAEAEKAYKEKLAEAEDAYETTKAEKIAEADDQYQKELAKTLAELELYYDGDDLEAKKAEVEAEAKDAYEKTKAEKLAEAEKTYNKKLAEAKETYETTKAEKLAEADKQFEEYMKTADFVALAEENGITVDSLVDEILPSDTAAGKVKIAEILSATYTVPFAGYDGINNDDTTDLDSSDCVAYIPVTVQGKEYNIFGITLPAINVGTWNVKAVNKTDSSDVVTGTVTIEKKSVTITQSDVISSTGVVTNTGEGIDVFNISDKNCNTVEVYVGLESSDNSSLADIGSNADKVFVSVIVPDSLPEIKVSTGSAATTVLSVSDAIKTYLEGKSVEDACALLNTIYSGAGDSVASFINAYCDGITDIEVKVNEYPSETGVYYAAAASVDFNYNRTYETALYYINGEDVADYTLNFNEAVSFANGVDTMYTSQDLGTTLYDENGVETGVKVYNIYIGKDLDGNGNGLSATTSKLDALESKLGDSSKAAIIEKIEAVLTAGSLPGGDKAAKAMTKAYSLYDIASDDDAAIAFAAEIAEEVMDNDFDLSDYGIYTSQDAIKAIGTGKYLQISVYQTSTGYIALPIYRVFTLVEDAVELSTPELKNVSSPKAGQNVVYWGKVDNAAGYKIFRKVEGQKWSCLATVEGGDIESYADATAETGVKYIYTVRAYIPGQLSGYQSGIAVIDIPNVTNVSANYSGDNYFFRVTWEAVDDATGYKIYRRQKGQTWSCLATVDGGDVNTYVDRSIDRSTNPQYFYTVRALRNQNGINAISYCNSGLYNLKAPKIDNVTSVSATKNEFTWEAVSGAQGYRIYRRTYDSKWQYVGTVKGRNTTKYVDSNVVAGTRYWYTVRAYRTSTISGKTDMSFYHLGGMYSLLAPKVTNVSSKSAAYNTVKWREQAGATVYRVFRKTAGNKWSYVGQTTKTYYVDKTAKKGTTYYYTVRAARSNNGTVGLSYYTSGLSTLGKPSFTVKATAKGQNTITWKKVSAANSYYVVYRKTSSGSYVFLKRTNALKFVDKTAKSGVKYTYAVRATRVANKSRDYSAYNEKSVKTK